MANALVLPRLERRIDPALRQGSGAEGPVRARILVVDDDERNAFAAMEALSELGHEVVIARSGEAALKRLLTETFALILLDLHMPGMDGYETAQFIRGRRRTRHIPILFVTAVFRDEAHIFQAYSAGAVDVVFKPVDPFILRSKVKVLVDLFLKTEELKRESEYRKRLLEENLRVLNEKARAEEALRKSRVRQEAILSSLPIVFTSRLVEPPFRPTFVSRSAERVTGFPYQQFISDPGFGFSRVHPEDRERLESALRAAPQTGSYTLEFRWRAADDSWRTFLDQGVLAPSLEGQPREVFSTLLDVTDRRLLEEQLAQARKMEAVGQLTGGVAHDFNNLLTVILGNVDLLGRRGSQDPKSARQIAAVRHAAERGKALTRQLLAFSRRQQLNPQVVDVNALIADFAPLLRQAVGESIVVQTALSSARLNVHVDPSQLEAALLNLAVNARDAMPRGGTLTLSTRQLTAKDDALRSNAELRDGRWVMIEVKDVGLGMDSELIERIFEPFFTTKEIGKGSGLGLSQVYGFVRQSGGQVAVESKRGEGSLFRLFLKASARQAAARSPAKAPKRVRRGRERLLVVEDDGAVLTLTVEMLEGLGYEVITASDAAQAFERLSNGEKVDLVFSDVVMAGGMSGIELARAARERRPDLRVLLTSGFVGAKATMAPGEFPLIDKPYERTVLAAKLRELLDGKKRRSPPRSGVRGDRLAAQ